MKFALICQPRTGSTAFANYFRDLGIFIYHEPFRTRKYPFVVDLTLKNIHKDSGAVGMKHVLTHVEQTYNELIMNWLLRNKIKIIALTRRNLAWASISLALARQTGVWEVNRKSEMDRLDYDSFQPKPLDIMSIQADMLRLSSLATIFDTYDSDVHRIYYEDFFNRSMDDVENRMSGLLHYLDIKPPRYYRDVLLDHFTPDQKHNQDYDKIPNWEEVKKVFGL